MKPLSLLLRGLIRAYQLLLAPLIPQSCRYLPSCSAYAAEAIVVHGPLKGCWLAARRIGRCHPWGGSGFDPVPPAAPPAHHAPLSSHACCCSDARLSSHDCATIRANRNGQPEQ